MKANDLIEKVKAVGSILIVAAAACIMISGATQFLAGIGRLVLWIGIVLVGALALALFTLWLRNRGNVMVGSTTEAKEMNPDGNGSPDKNHLAAIWAVIGCLTLTSSQVLPGNAQVKYLKGEATKYALIPKGSTFEGRIDKTIGSSASRQGEVFKITLSSPVLSNGQDVVIPAGSEVVGEVVECIPSKTIPHPKNTPPVTGVLRTQLTSLRTPEGNSYPLVASLAGELVNTKNGKAQVGGLGDSKGYIGTSESLNQVGQKKKKRSRFDKRDDESGTAEDDETIDTWSHRSDRTRAGAYSPGVLDREGEDATNKEDPNAIIRSLVKRNGDLFIFAGSPLTVKLKAPMRIAINRPMDEIPDVSSPSNSMNSPDINPVEIPDINAPKSNAPKINAPKINAPSMSAPDQIAPSTNVPSMSVPDKTAPSTNMPSMTAPGMDSPATDAEPSKMTNSSGNFVEQGASQLPSASPNEIIPAPGITDDKNKLDSQMKNSSTEIIKQSTTEQVHQLEDKSF